MTLVFILLILSLTFCLKAKEYLHSKLNGESSENRAFSLLQSYLNPDVFFFLKDQQYKDKEMVRKANNFLRAFYVILVVTMILIVVSVIWNHRESMG